jgi:hypothetical protein
MRWRRCLLHRYDGGEDTADKYLAVGGRTILGKDKASILVCEMLIEKSY